MLTPKDEARIREIVREPRTPVMSEREREKWRNLIREYPVDRM